MKENRQQVENLVNLLDGYATKGGHHLNVNVLNRDTLLDAQKNPEKYQLEAKDLKALTVFDENTYLRLKGQLKECSYRKGEGDTINYELSR